MAITTIYQLPSDQVAGDATISAQTGTEDTDYLLLQVGDGYVNKPGKFTTTTGAILFDFGSAQRVDIFALGPHNLQAALSVAIQANATDAWGAPTLSTAVTIPTPGEDGHVGTPWVDLTGISGYSAGGFRYWRLNISSANSEAISIGEVWMGQTKRSMTRPYQWGSEWSDRWRFVAHESLYGAITTYDLGVRQRRFRGHVATRAAGETEMLAFHRSLTGQVHVGLFIPDSKFIDAWWVRAGPEFAVTTTYTNYIEMNVDLQEVSFAQV